MKNRTIDLNADIGEGAGYDTELATIISSASIACGGHAGDDRTMRETLLLTKSNGVVAGAHPGFADKSNFGRKRLELPHSEIATQVFTQVSRLQKIAREERVNLRYVKLHGALANIAAEDEQVATACFEAVQRCDPQLAIMAIAGTVQSRAAAGLGLRVITEAYADRTYTSDGLLVPRGEPGAVLATPQKVVAQCLRLAQNGEISCPDGTVLRTTAQSICLHGDTPGAITLARHISRALKEAGISFASPL